MTMAGQGAPPQDLTAQIELHEVVGEGSFSTVHRGTWTYGRGMKRTVAVKILRPSNKKHWENASIVIQRRLDRESRLWNGMNHPYVLKFFGIYQRQDQFLSAMISPFCPRGNVITFLEGREVDRPLMIFHISEGLEYLHSRNIVHGDLKGNNVLIDERGTPVLSDFGRSRLLDSHGFTTGFAGATRYLAPEILAPLDASTDHDNFTPELTKASDVYGFGMVGLEILTGDIPFASVKHDTVVVVMVSGGRKPSKPRLSSYHSRTWDILDRCWERQPALRPVIGVIVQAMPERLSRG